VALKSCEGVGGRGVSKFAFFCQESMRRFDMAPFATLLSRRDLSSICYVVNSWLSQRIMTFPFFVVRSQELKK
jgi:hypothetical protein